MKSNSKEIDLDVLLSPDEAWRRITAESEEQRFLINLSKPFVYKISGNEITIEKVRRYYRNSFSSSLKMQIYPTAYGCSLRGRFSSNVSPLLLIGESLAFLAIFGWASSFFGELRAAQSSFNNVAAYLVPVLVIVVVSTMPLFGRFLAKGEERKIAEWLNRLFSESIVRH